MHTPSVLILIALASLTPAGEASSQSLYVSDKLVLNVYAEPNQSGGRVATIETGDAVEQLERVDNFLRVRLTDGREGWVGANYLSTEPPAIVKLKQLEAGQPVAAPSKQSLDEMARLQKQNAVLNAQIAELKKSTAVPSVAALPAEEKVVPIVERPVEPEQPSVITPAVVIPRDLWWAWALAVIAAGSVGFVAGYQTLARRVRARFGGVKVY
ncbi:MAG TPA: SH3 domain-containing protein [Steroidobacteraceae bacterium]|nr:SH3 domain-containing protein [Steroidobacteraceae bacterium]